jgi:hypothetical protein
MDDDEQEIEALHALFSELPIEVIRFIWQKSQGDKAQCQEQLGRIACSEEELAKVQAEMLGAGISSSGGYGGLQSRNSEVRLRRQGIQSPVRPKLHAGWLQVHATESQRPAEIRMTANSSGSLGAS